MQTLPLLILFMLVPTENWLYPNTSGVNAANAHVGDQTVGTSFTIESDDSFDTVTNWYAKRTGFGSLSKRIAAYRNREPGDSDFDAGTANAIKIEGSRVSNATALYNFSPHHMHAMLVFTDRQTGDMLSISIAGNDKFTTVNFVRRPRLAKEAD